MNDQLLTDHALIRYMERILGLDLSGIRADILTPPRVRLVKTIRTGRIPCGGGCDLVVQNGRIVTVSPRVHIGDPPQKKIKGKR